MVTPEQIEDGALAITWVALQDGADCGSMICAQLTPALLAEINIRFKGASSASRPPMIRVNFTGLDEDDFKEAIGRLMALEDTWRHYNYKNAARFAVGLLLQIEAARIEGNRVGYA